MIIFMILKVKLILFKELKVIKKLLTTESTYDIKVFKIVNACTIYIKILNFHIIVSTKFFIKIGNIKFYLRSQVRLKSFVLISFKKNL